MSRPDAELSADIDGLPDLAAPRSRGSAARNPRGLTAQIGASVAPDVEVLGRYADLVGTAAITVARHTAHTARDDGVTVGWSRFAHPQVKLVMDWGITLAPIGGRPGLGAGVARSAGSGAVSIPLRADASACLRRDPSPQAGAHGRPVTEPPAIVHAGPSRRPISRERLRLRWLRGFTCAGCETGGKRP